MARRFVLALMALCAAFLVSIALLGLAARPLADDYCTYNEAIVSDPVSVTVLRYGYWTGRYSESFFKAALAPMQSTLTPLLPALMQAATLLGWGVLLWQVATLVGLQGRRTWWWGSALYVAFALASSAPSLQNLYWFAVLAHYSIALPLLLGVLALALWAGQAAPRTRWQLGAAALLAAGLALVIAGLAEGYATVQLVLYGGMLLWLGPQQGARAGQGRVVLVAAGIAALIGLALAISAPGNYARQQIALAEFGDNRVLFPELIPVTLFSTLELAFFDTFGLAHQAATLLAVLVLCRALLPREVLLAGAPPRLGRLAWGGLLLVLLGVAAIFAPAYYGTGLVAGRTLYPARALLLALWALWGYLGAVALARHNFPAPRLARRPIYRTVQAAVLGVVLFLPTLALGVNVGRAGDFAAFATDWDARDAYLRAVAAEGASEAHVPPLSVNLADLFTLEDIGIDGEATWVGACAARYYGLERLDVDSNDCCSTQP